MRVLVDTVTFIWALRSPELISRHAFSALESEATIRELSSISITEIGMMHSAGKLNFDKGAVIDGVEDLKLRVLPYSEEHAFRLFDLECHHADPFDRQIIVQALTENIPVITPDEKFRVYAGLRIIW
ncbi:MAG TPA: type II toxin-antitoxin system VapC family toxin [Candidatus Aquilonibacter sp.]|nr:type II toxin-antitoxin system VapC family toxin [Candidatus Aquilonibacter sp.]